MKKLRTSLCAALLSTVLVGNVFAGDLGIGAFTVLSNAVGAAIMALVGGPADCRPRDCQQCRPDQLDSDGNCRPSGS